MKVVSALVINKHTNCNKMARVKISEFLLAFSATSGDNLNF